MSARFLMFWPTYILDRAAKVFDRVISHRYSLEPRFLRFYDADGVEMEEAAWREKRKAEEEAAEAFEFGGAANNATMPRWPSALPAEFRDATTAPPAARPDDAPQVARRCTPAAAEVVSVPLKFLEGVVYTEARKIRMRHPVRHLPGSAKWADDRDKRAAEAADSDAAARKERFSAAQAAREEAAARKERLERSVMIENHAPDLVLATVERNADGVCIVGIHARLPRRPGGIR